MKSLDANTSITACGINTSFGKRIARSFHDTLIEINADVINFNITTFTKTMIAACDRDPRRTNSRLFEHVRQLNRSDRSESRSYAVRTICVFIQTYIFFCRTFINISTTAITKSITNESSVTFTVVVTFFIHTGCPRGALSDALRNN